MPTRTQHITHRFSGGWSPELGKFVSGLPQQTAEIQIPFVLEADNIFWTLDGGFRQIDGATKISTQLENGADIMGVYDYWRIGITGSATQRKLCHVGQFIYEDGGNDTFVKLGAATYTTLDVGAQPNYCTFNDLLIISSNSISDVPMSWDQTTFQNLAGSPPNFSFCVEHKNRLWASGASTNPSRLYYTSADNPEDWVGSGSGFIDVSPGDGDEVRGIASFKNDLWVFKGPYKGSIHRITGSSPPNFAKVLFTRGTAAVGHSSIVPFKDDLAFMTSHGSVLSLKSTAAFGDYAEAGITFPINTWLNENINHAALQRVWGINASGDSRIYFSIPTGASTRNDTVLVFDYASNPARWSKADAWPAHSLANINVLGHETMFFGGEDGFVRKLDVSTPDIDTTVPVATNVLTPNLNYGSSVQFKTLSDVGLTLSPKDDTAVSFEWVRDGNSMNSFSLAQGAANNALRDTVSPLASDFLLDSSLLSGPQFNEIYHDAEEGGDFRWVQYRIGHEALKGSLALHAFSAGLQFGAFGTE